MGNKRLAALVLQDFDDFRDRLKAQGKSIGYVSRILSVLRSSANRALENKKTTVKLKVPEYQPRSKKKNLKKKGPLLGGGDQGETLATIRVRQRRWGRTEGRA
jgi:hypothetical protein